MAISSSFSRLTAYYTRHGFVATIRRAGLALKRALFASRMVVFYCDLGKLNRGSCKDSELSKSRAVKKLR